MSQNSRKRPAPGAAPLLPVTSGVPTGYNTTTPQDQVLQWAGSIPDARNLNDLPINANPYLVGAPGQYIQQQARQQQQIPLQSAQPQQLHLQPQPLQPQQQQQGLAQTSTAIARRPPNRALIPSAPRVPFDPNADPWANFGDDAGALAATANGGGGGTGGLPGENESIEVLEERAQRVKKEAQSKRKQIPPFVQKLSSFLEEQKNTDLIRWSENGDSFIVLDEDEFAKTLIPELFKHNNYASFVRQLNMYGFHKRVGLSDNSMKASERKNKSPSEYYNPYFRRGHPNLLWLINKPKSGSKAKRGKKEDGEGDSDEDVGLDEPSTLSHQPGGLQGLPNNQPNHNYSASGGSGVGGGGGGGTSGELGPLQKKDFQLIKDELSTLQTRQAQISKVMQRLQYDNAQLQQQARLFQNMHERHENSINAILNFLANVFRKSLEEQGGVQGVTELLASILPNGQMPQGSVVDLSDDFDQRRPSAATTVLSTPPKRQQRLLPPIPAPVASRSSASVSSAGASPAAAAAAGGRVRAKQSGGVVSPQSHHVAPGIGGAGSGYQPGLHVGQQPAMGSVTELFDSPGDSSSYLQHELQANPQEGMMKIIHDTNANTPSSAIDLPEMAASTPVNLSTDQRNRVLNLMSGQNQGAQNASGIGTSPRTGAGASPGVGTSNPLSPNGLVAGNVPLTGPGGVPLSSTVPITLDGLPDFSNLGGTATTAGSSTSLSPILAHMQSVPPPPSLRDISNTQSEIEELQRMQDEQNAKISDLSQLLGPLSPSGRVPGIDEDVLSNHGGSVHSAAGGVPGGQSPGYFDLGQYLDSTAFGDDFNFATGDLSDGGHAAGIGGTATATGGAGVGGPGVTAGVDGADFNFGLDNANGNGGGVKTEGHADNDDDDGENGLFGNTPSPTTTEEIQRTDLSSVNSPDTTSKRRRVT